MSAINQSLIAQKLGLSRATVSRSLANHPAISAETRARVQGLADEMGYRPSPGRILKRHGKSGKKATVGVLIGIPAENVQMATFPYILQGLRERAQAEEVDIDVFYQPPGDFQVDGGRQPVFRHMRENDWRGAVLIYPFDENAVVAISKRISTVAVLESYNSPHIDIIDTDDASAILFLVETLKAAGHRRIGFLSWHYPVGGHWVARRFSGYVEALFLHGMEFNQDWVLNVHKQRPPLMPPQVADTVARLVREQGVTAWVCAADHQAYQLMMDLQVRGLRVPEHCSVSGFDGLEPPAGMIRAASMRVPHRQIGSSAIMRLMNRIEHPSSPRRKILVEAEFVAGDSIARVPGPV